jgi:hypothetical protein
MFSQQAKSTNAQADNVSVRKSAKTPDIVQRAPYQRMSFDSGSSVVQGLQHTIGNRAVAQLFRNKHGEEAHSSALELCQRKVIPKKTHGNSTGVVQRVVFPNMNAMWAVVNPGFDYANIRQDSALKKLYQDAAAQLPNTDFVHVAGQQPQITSTPGLAQPYSLDWDAAANIGWNDDYFAGSIIHELAHATVSEQYRRNGANQGDLIWANLNLPVAAGVVNPLTGMTPNQDASYNGQHQTLDANWTDLDAEATADNQAGTINNNVLQHLQNRIGYAMFARFTTVHNETVLADIMYYLRANNLQDSRTYKFARRMLKEANDRRRNGMWSRTDTEVRRVDRGARWYQFWKW